ncbi:hypothetical protein E4T66_18530 [Sinimarinibacterium sp. CAU 1509]|uniref:hypothetical protein n=1 Tax=Sinimarinibacterium sp. CAU 1509 TaxID=2562283 RepID=UPI0010AC150A|nr:hypothetical protein [Sinimarinibacterium sp. CAU 1509]TJY57404.1 hypothetical protein E4T66_18530 [Sinimarinibacterium sp. CAU 1509]
MNTLSPTFARSDSFLTLARTFILNLWRFLNSHRAMATGCACGWCGEALRRGERVGRYRWAMPATDREPPAHGEQLIHLECYPMMRDQTAGSPATWTPRGAVRLWRRDFEPSA